MNTSQTSQTSREDFMMDRADPDQLGELLRSFIFVGNPGDVGCYTTFETIEPIKTYDEKEKLAFWDSVGCVYHLNQEDTTYEEIHSSEEDNRELTNISDVFLFQVGDVKVEAGWAWNGDGTLAFTLSNDSSFRAVINTDCKKSYGWKNAFNSASVS